MQYIIRLYKSREDITPYLQKRRRLVVRYEAKGPVQRNVAAAGPIECEEDILKQMRGCNARGSLCLARDLRTNRL